MKYDNLKNLSDEYLFEGLIKCCENVISLVESAELLAEEGRYGVATSLIILGVEEQAKSFWLSLILINKELAEELKEEFEGSGLHQKRLELAHFSSTFIKTALESGKKYSDLNDLFLSNVDKTVSTFNEEKDSFSHWFSHSNKLKQKGFYLDLIDCKWSSPQGIIEKDYENAVQNVVHLLSQSKAEYDYFSGKTVEDYQQHFKDFKGFEK